MKELGSVRSENGNLAHRNERRHLFGMTIRIATALTLFAVLPLGAEENRNRMVFPTKTPKAGATSQNAAPTPSGSPEALLQRFFADLKADKLDAAYANLAKNTIIAERAENLEQLKEKTREAIDNFGPVQGYEAVQTDEIGSVLFRQTCISLNTDLPLRWRFYFYRTGGQWKLVDLRVDDGIADLFDEVSRKGAK